MKSSLSVQSLAISAAAALTVATGVELLTSIKKVENEKKRHAAEFQRIEDLQNGIRTDVGMTFTVVSPTIVTIQPFSQYNLGHNPTLLITPNSKQGTDDTSTITLFNNLNGNQALDDDEPRSAFPLSTKEKGALPFVQNAKSDELCDIFIQFHDQHSSWTFPNSTQK